MTLDEEKKLNEEIKLDEKRRKIILIDDSAYIHKYYHAYPKKQISYNKRRLEVGALTGLIHFTDNIRKNFSDDATIIHVLDPDNGSQYRKSLFPEYKQRKEKDEDLKVQISLLPKILSGYHERWIKVDGVESDDVIAKFAQKYGRDDLVLIIGEDKDIFQNIIDYREDGFSGIVSACRYTKGSSGFNSFDMIFSDYILEKYKVMPYQIADFLALVGDTADNIPGAKGIGEVSAKKLLLEYGNLNNIILAAKSGEIQGKNNQKILDSLDDIILSKKLTLPFLDFQIPDIEDIEPCYDPMISREVKKIVPPDHRWIMSI